MNRRLVSVFLFALVVAGVASLLLYYLLSAKISTMHRAGPASKLLVAAHDLEVGSLIREGDLEQIAWEGASPSDAISDVREAAGRGVVSNIYQGEPISMKRLAPKGAGAGLAATIPVGKRAVALATQKHCQRARTRIRLRSTGHS